MDTGTSYFLAAIVSSVASITVAFIGGMFAVQAAKARMDQTDNGTKHKLSFGKVGRWIALVIVLSIPFSCIFGFTFNYLSLLLITGGDPQGYYIDIYQDTFDPTVIGAIMCAVGFVTGVIVSRTTALNKRE